MRAPCCAPLPGQPATQALSPLASLCSLAQVHEAIDHDGKRLAVKVGNICVAAVIGSAARWAGSQSMRCAGACEAMAAPDPHFAAACCMLLAPPQVQHRGLRETSALDLATIDVLVKVSGAASHYNRLVEKEGMGRPAVERAAAGRAISTARCHSLPCRRSCVGPRVAWLTQHSPQLPGRLPCVCRPPSSSRAAPLTTSGWWMNQRRTCRWVGGMGGWVDGCLRRRQRALGACCHGA